MKRFYKTASILKNEHGACLSLDSKLMRTPKQNPLLIPTQLDDIILKEWNDVTTTINPHLMPATQILITAQDLYNEKKDTWYNEILSYLETDLLFYRSEQPPEIYTKQVLLYNPIVSQLETELDCNFLTTTGLTPLIQNPQTSHKFEIYLQSLSPLAFTGFYLTTIETGSACLAAALSLNLITTEAAFNAIFLEEIHKAEIYLEDIHGLAPDLAQKQETLKNYLTAAQIIFQSLSN